MPGSRKRRGVTLVELSLVIAILAMIALPFAAFVSQNLRNTVQSGTQLKEQLVLEQVMQDMEKRLRSAVTSTITFPTNGITFTSQDPKRNPGDALTTTQYTYVLANGLLKKNGTTFPDGLEAGMITSLTFPTSSLTTAPYYITVRIEAYNTKLGTTTYLEKTIYLRNY